MHSKLQVVHPSKQKHRPTTKRGRLADPNLLDQTVIGEQLLRRHRLLVLEDTSLDGIVQGTPEQHSDRETVALRETGSKQAQVLLKGSGVWRRLCANHSKLAHHDVLPAGDGGGAPSWPLPQYDHSCAK
jgi:hypothetical protein